MNAQEARILAIAKRELEYLREPALESDLARLISQGIAASPIGILCTSVTIFQSFSQKDLRELKANDFKVEIKDYAATITKDNPFGRATRISWDL